MLVLLRTNQRPRASMASLLGEPSTATGCASEDTTSSAHRLVQRGRKLTTGPEARNV